MVDEDRDNGDGGVGGGGADRHSVVDRNGDGGAGGRFCDAKKTMAMAMTTTRSERKIFSDVKVSDA